MTTAVILSGGLDFGRCPLATELVRGMWPLVDRPVVRYQIEQLKRVGMTGVVVCTSGDYGARREGIDEPGCGIRVDWLVDRMPRGSAGCIKDAARGIEESSVLVVEGGVFWIVNGDDVMRRHRESGAAMTLFTTRCDGGREGRRERLAGVYICEREALEMVQESGYCDLKEELLPALLAGGAAVRAEPLPGEVITVRGTRSYLGLVGRALSSPGEVGLDLGAFDERERGVWLASGAEVDAAARLVGPVVVLEGASVGGGALVMGPAVIGREGRVESGAILDGSVVWEGGVVGADACVTESVVGRRARVKPGEMVSGLGVATKRRRREGTRRVRSTAAAGEGGKGREVPVGLKGSAAVVAGRAKPAGKTAKVAAVSTGAGAGGTWGAFGLPAAALGALLWAYWSVFADLWEVWQRNDNYSSGALVPFLAAYVIFLRRKKLARVPMRPFYWGLGVVAGGFAMRLAGTMLFFGSAERLSLVVVVVGVVLTLFGFRIARRLFWVLAFLLLMLPWPTRIYYAVSLPLQEWATVSAAFVLELLGWFVIREGNILQVGDTSVAVTEACSGLRMLTAFMVVSALAALMCKRATWQKAVLVASSVPIAVLCNIIRLTVTSMAYTAGYGAAFEQFFHDFYGIAMMPVALGLLAGELWLMGRMFVPAEADARETAGNG